MKGKSFENVSVNDIGNIQPVTSLKEDADSHSLDTQIKERYFQDTKYRKYLANWVM